MKYTLKYMQMKTDLNGLNIFDLLKSVSRSNGEKEYRMPHFMKICPFQKAATSTINVK